MSHLIRCLGALLLALSCAVAQAYPDRPVKILVGYPPGGPTDLLARLVAKHLSDEFGKPFIVENKPGVNSGLAMGALVDSPPDGHTLMLGTVANAINQSMYRTLKYDVRRDVQAIGPVSSVANLLLVPAQSPVQTFEQLVEQAKAKPGTLFYASGGAGTSAHLAGELLKARLGIDMTHVAFKGAAAAATATIGGETQVLVDNVTTALPFVRAGRLRPLLVTSASRAPSLPNVPTVKERTGRDLDVTSWTGLVAPRNTPDGIVQALNGALRKIQQQQAFRDGLMKVDNNVREGSPREFSDFIASEVDKWAAAIKASGAQVD